MYVNKKIKSIGTIEAKSVLKIAVAILPNQ